MGWCGWIYDDDDENEGFGLMTFKDFLLSIFFLFRLSLSKVEVILRSGFLWVYDGGTRL